MDDPYANCKVYGPYERKQDGRYHVVLVHSDGRKQTVSYPKFLLEKRIGRILAKDETVDHIDRDPLNNDPSNLQILKRSDHCGLDAKHADLSGQRFICEICGKYFVLSGRRLQHAATNRDKGRTGPFCSRSCAGKATHIKDCEIQPVVIRHYFIEKSLVSETSQVDPAKSENPSSMGIPS